MPRRRAVCATATRPSFAVAPSMTTRAVATTRPSSTATRCSAASSCSSYSSSTGTCCSTTKTSWRRSSAARTSAASRAGRTSVTAARTCGCRRRGRRAGSTGPGARTSACRSCRRTSCSGRRRASRRCRPGPTGRRSSGTSPASCAGTSSRPRGCPSGRRRRTRPACPCRSRRAASRASRRGTGRTTRPRCSRPRDGRAGRPDGYAGPCARRAGSGWPGGAARRAAGAPRAGAGGSWPRSRACRASAAATSDRGPGRCPARGPRRARSHRRRVPACRWTPRKSATRMCDRGPVRYSVITRGEGAMPIAQPLAAIPGSPGSFPSRATSFPRLPRPDTSRSMADSTSAATTAAPVPDPDAIARAERFTRERFVHAGEEPADALAPGSGRRLALDAALSEIDAGASVPSTHWRRRYSLLLGLERVLSEDEPRLADGTTLNPHQVDALSGPLTALLAEAQRNGDVPAPAATPVLAVDDEPADEPGDDAEEDELEDDEDLDEDDEVAAEEEPEVDAYEEEPPDDVDEDVAEGVDDPNAHKRFWFEHATGAGKTVAAMGFVEASRTGGILILTHRRNLVDQFNGE